jgi:hypothetical protein
VPELERDFQKAVIQLARMAGWRVAHFRVSKSDKGWRTPVAADGAGFPDLCMVKGDRLVFAELKSATGTVSSEQQVWLDQLKQTSAEVHLWRPDDWPVIVKTLAGKTLRSAAA